MPLDLAFHEIGQGPPLMILHGLFGSGSNWGSIAKTLSKTHRVFIVDLRNHGNSPHAETMSYEEMASDVLALVDQQGFEKVMILGHSMGGKTSMMVALTAPHRIERMAVVDIAPVSYPHHFSSILNALKAVNLNEISGREEVDQLLQENIPELGLRQFLLKNLNRDQQHFRWKINLEAIEQAMPQLTGFPLVKAAPFQGKVLFIGGKNSDYLVREYYPRIYQSFPKAKIVMIKNAGHWVHAEQPEALLQTLNSFIKI